MDTRRLMLLMVFAFSLFMLWDAWQKQQNPLPPQNATRAQERQNAAIPQPGSDLRPATQNDAGVPVPSANARADSAAGSAAGSAIDSATGSAAAEVLTVRTDLFTARISAQGGDLTGLELHKFRAHGDREKPLELFGPQHQYAAQTGLIAGKSQPGLPNHKTLLTPEDGPRALADGQDSFQVRLTAPEIEGIRATKVYTFRRDSYLIDVAWEIENGSAQELTPFAYFQLQRDGVAPDGDSFMISTFYGASVYTDAEKYRKATYKDLAEDKTKFAKTGSDGWLEFAKPANDGWLAMVQHYFVTAWVPQDDTKREFTLRKLDDKLYAAALIVPVEKLAPGAKTVVAVPLFAGPQEQDRLKQVAPGLDLVVDYGWLHILAAPIFAALSRIHSLLGNWGWSIVVLTIFIKLLFFPLSAASYKSMAKMRTMTPKLAQLKERHADDKQRLNQEMMKLYQTEKINPLGGCLPILVQIPVFIALYWVLLGAVEMRDAPWIFWIHDLSAADPYYVLPVIMMASMFLQTRLNPTPPDPIQAKMMLMMPLIFGVMFFFFPAGLVLYWVVNNILSIAQQWQITRLIEKGGNKPKKAANDPKA
jgi:YidC/Oxa1 family membrane protein insertase